MLSKQSQYVLRALMILASKNELMDIKTIAEKENIPMRFLASLMQELSRKKIISSKKGKKGGFYLTDKQMKISLFEVISQYEDIGKFSACGMGFDKCSEKSPCPLHFFYKKYRDELKKMFLSRKIKDLPKNSKIKRH